MCSLMYTNQSEYSGIFLSSKFDKRDIFTRHVHCSPTANLNSHFNAKELYYIANFEDFLFHMNLISRTYTFLSVRLE